MKNSKEENVSVLIVEDERDMGRLLSDILREEGYEVNNAYDGNTAINKLRKDRYDIMILDYNLSGMTGFNVLEKVKEISPEIKTIMISAYGDNRIKKKAKEYGVNNFLDKPFDINNLLNTLKETSNTEKIN